VLYTGLSLTHGNAQTVTALPAVWLGNHAVISERFTKTRLWDICRKHGCTTFSNLGGILSGLYAEPPRPDDADNPVRVVNSAGTPRAIWEAFERRFDVKIHEWYGTMEGGLAHKPAGVGPIGSFGKPVEGLFQMKVVREDGSECVPGEVGELISRPGGGAAARVDYYNNPEASKKKTEGGWLRTGDMVHRDAEGYLFFDYRKGGGIRHNGDFVHPDFVERAIAEHPQVSEVFVYGVDAASGAPGERDVVAAVVPFSAADFDVASVFDKCRRDLEPNFVPTYLQVVGEIPKTISEKPQERFLRAAFSPDAENVYAG
jgi:crotonobetaine/carnitine-CoA ligase